MYQPELSLRAIPCTLMVAAAVIISLFVFCPNQYDICILRGIRLPLHMLVRHRAMSSSHETEHSRQFLSANSPPSEGSLGVYDNSIRGMYDSHHSAEHHSANAIPMVIYQTYNHKQLIPSKVDENLRLFAPGYRRYIYDDEECLDFLQKHFHPHVVEGFRYLKGPHKADLFRYAVLYIHGGVYLDIKTQLLVPLEEIFPHRHPNNTNPTTYTCLCWDDVESDGIPRCMYQGIIATPRGNPLFLRAIQQMLAENIPIYEYHLVVKQMYELVNEQIQVPHLKEGLNAAPSVARIHGNYLSGVRNPTSSVVNKSRSGTGFNVNVDTADSDSSAVDATSDEDTEDGLFLRHHKTFDFYLLKERKLDVSECPDGKDRYGYCYYVYDGEKRVIKTRYSDYPWHPKRMKNELVPVCNMLGMYKQCKGGLARKQYLYS
jgi:Glycosyltransferase sugar-binding region containing DXD motif